MTPIWKLMPLENNQAIQTVWRKWDDGKQESCLVTDEAYLKWLAEGNTPEAADAATLPAENA
jgi:hypothetical protein